MTFEPRDPTPKELASPLFEAIWQTIKTWDINAPWYSGYCGATGNHAAVILRALTAALSGSPQVEAGMVEALKEAHAILYRGCFNKEAEAVNAAIRTLRPREQEGGEAKANLTQDEQRIVMKALDASSPLLYEFGAHPAPLPADGWKDIETAPKDGTHLLLATEGYAKVRIGWFYANAWRWDGSYDGISYGKPPTAWRHVPTPPASTEGGADA